MTQKTNGIVADIMVLGDVEAQMGASAGLEAEGVETPKAGAPVDDTVPLVGLIV